MAAAPKRSVALAIRPSGAHGAHESANSVLIVQRPPDDEHLPNVWGLPAASLRESEDWIDAARRAARDKLGIEIAVGAEIAHGSQLRGGRPIEMRVFDATITRGWPSVPQQARGVTQYVAWRWGDADDLEPGAARGSLCCRLYAERSGSISRRGRADRSGSG